MKTLYPTIQNPEHATQDIIKNPKILNGREVMGSSYPAGLYKPILQYWSNLKAQTEYEDDESHLQGTTWIELTLDFIATYGIIPCSLGYGATNIETATLSFKTIAQQIFLKHGTIITPHVKYVNRLEPLGLNRNTGISARVKLNNQEYVQACLIHRVCVQEQNYENKDRFKFWPVYKPPHITSSNIIFNIRWGLLQGQQFEATYDHVIQIPENIINGTTKNTARAELARIKKTQFIIPTTYKSHLTINTRSALMKLLRCSTVCVYVKPFNFGGKVLDLTQLCGAVLFAVLLSARMLHHFIFEGKVLDLAQFRGVGKARYASTSLASILTCARSTHQAKKC